MHGTFESVSIVMNIKCFELLDFRVTFQSLTQLNYRFSIEFYIIVILPNPWIHPLK